MKKTILFCCLCGLSIPVLAIDTLDTLTQQLSQHPKVMRLLERSDYFNQAAESQYGLPNPEIILGIDNLPFNDPAFDRFLPTSKVLGVRQSIPAKQLRQSQAEENSIRAQQSELEADYQLQQLKAMLTLQLVRQSEIKQLAQKQQQKLHLINLMQKELRGQLAAGMSGLSELDTLDIKRTQVGLRISELNGEQNRIDAILRSLIDNPVEIEIPLIQMRNEDNLKRIYPLLIAEQDIAIAQQQIATADAQFAPKFNLQALYKQRESGANFNGDDWLSVQASVSLPLWSSARLNANKRAASANKRQTDAAFDEVKRETLKQMQILQADYASNQQSLELLKQQKQSVGQSIGALRSRYQSGEINQQTLLSAELNLVDVSSQIIQTEATLQRLAIQFNSFIVGGNDV